MNTTKYLSKDETNIENKDLKQSNNVEDSRKTLDSESEVQQFYTGKNVLITGATGFIGKVLMEKLLRSCSGLERLYILVRQKRGKDLRTRTDEVFDDPVFHCLKKDVPEFRHKVVLVQGDCKAVDLGLTVSDKQALQENINIIFHCAATVNFDQNLRTILTVNVRATLYLLDLAKQMKNLKCFMQISTAFSNSYLNCIDEKFYSTNVIYEDLQKTVDGLTEKEVKDQTPKIIGSKWPNTYAFSKALAEDELLKRRDRVPLCIFRPSIVTSTAKEPFRSWVGNKYGPMGIVVGCASGILRTLHCNPSAAADLVPVDYVVNCMLVASLNVHELYNSSTPPPEPPIFNFVSSTDNRLTWYTFQKLNSSKLDLYPLSSAVWYKIMLLNRNWYVHQICAILLHLLPALLIDGFLVCLCKKPRMMQIYRKVRKLSSVMSYFTTKEFNFKNNRTQSLWAATSNVDKQLFPFDMRTLDWEDYFQDFLLGMRRYLLKESDETLAQARIKWRRLYYLHQIVCIILFLCVLFAIYASVKCIL